MVNEAFVNQLLPGEQPLDNEISAAATTAIMSP
jgi:hypothetical protein